MEETSALERRQIEIELLQAMYPDQIHRFNSDSNEFGYTSTSTSTTTVSGSGSGSAAGVLVLRLPETYPERELPRLVSATDSERNDIRRKVQRGLDEMRLVEGEEVLDAIVQGFEGVLEGLGERDGEGGESVVGGGRKDDGVKTVVVWLHHLLNTNKRKLALSPSLVLGEEKRTSKRGRGGISGITKPGYPGILIYSGPADLVDAHVMELRQQRWQAFQVRFEEEFGEDVGEGGKGGGRRQAWKFEHGEGIKEVESMAEVVQDIVDPVDRETFLRATGVK